MKKISLPEAVEWRISDWLPAFEFVLDQVPRHLPQGARVLDMGHGTGKMSCFLAQQFDWQLEGLEINPTYYPAAQQLVDNCGVSNKVSLKLIKPEETFDIEGPYDAIFLKSFLYHVKDRQTYKKWVDWFHKILKPGGYVIGIENSKGHALDRLYRKTFTGWGDQLLYDDFSEQLFKEKFSSYKANYFGYLSQYFSFLPVVPGMLRKVENTMGLPKTGKSFVTSFYAQK